MHQAIERFTAGGLTAAVLGLTGILVYREFLRTPERPPVPPPEFVAEWEDALGAVFTPAAVPSRVRIVEFIDLECPACSAYAPVIANIREEYGAEVSVQYVHFPMAYHGHALAAAKAAECAQASGTGDAFVTTVLARQKEFGATSWADLARDAGVDDSTGFRRCMDAEGQPPRIQEGLDVGERLGVNATPTLFIEGWRYDQLPDEKQLSQFIQKLLEGKVARPPATPASGAVHPTRYQDGEVDVLEFGAEAIARAPVWESRGTPIATVTDGPGGFAIYDAQEFVSLADGRFVTMSPNGPELRIFGADGQSSDVIGRSGAGPGEWQSITSIARTHGDTLVFIDPANMRLNFAPTHGGRARSEPLTGRLPLRANRIIGSLGRAGIIVSMLGRTESTQPVGRRTRTSAPVFVLPPDDTARRLFSVPDIELEVVETRYGGRRGTEPMPLGFGARTRAVTWGEFVAVATGDDPRVDLYGSDGKLLRSLRLHIQRQPVDDDMRAAEVTRRLDELASYRERPIDPAESRRLIREMPFADSLPPFDGMFVSPGGVLWLTDGRAPGASRWSATALRSDGAIIARLIVEDDGQPVAFGDDRVLMRSVDSDGVVTLRMLPMGPSVK